jgi:hypothetical protein
MFSSACPVDGEQLFTLWRRPQSEDYEQERSHHEKPDWLRRATRAV